MKRASILFLGLIMACAPVRVNYDYDEKADFNKYKTYNYYSDLETGLSTFDTKRLLDILDDEMRAKGMSLSGDPDFYINIYSSTSKNVNASSFGVAVGGTGDNIGGAVNMNFPVQHFRNSRKIVFDFIDEEGQGLFWRAVSESGYIEKGTANEREAILKAVVQEVLSNYPPDL